MNINTEHKEVKSKKNKTKQIVSPSSPLPQIPKVAYDIVPPLETGPH